MTVYVSDTPLTQLADPKRAHFDCALETHCERRLRELPDSIFFQAKRWIDVSSVKANTLLYTLVMPQNANFVQAFPANEGNEIASHIRIFDTEIKFAGTEFFAGHWVNSAKRLPEVDGEYYTTDQFYRYPPPRHVTRLSFQTGKWWSNFYQRTGTTKYWWEFTPL